MLFAHSLDRVILHAASRDCASHGTCICSILACQLGISRQVLCTQEWLKLLEQDEDYSYLVIAVQVLHRRPLDTFDIHSFLVGIFLRGCEFGLLLQNIRLLTHQIFQELSKHQCCSLVLFFLTAELVLDLKTVVLHIFVLSLRVS